MATYNTFHSFCNWMKSELSGSGLIIAIDGSIEPKELPYLYIFTGIQIPRNVWIENQIVRAELLVGKIATEDLTVTTSKWVKEVTRASLGGGTITKYDYHQTPPVEIGKINVKLNEIRPTANVSITTSRNIFEWSCYANLD